MKRRNWFIGTLGGVFAGVVMSFTPGCSSPGKDIADLSEAPPVMVSSNIVPGDTVELKFYYAPELNDTQAVRRDGKLALQLVGDVDAAGQTPSQLTETLRQRYGEHLKQPDVTVILRNSQNNRVYVSGEVIRPGLIEMPGTLTVQQAVMMAGGFNMNYAEPTCVVVMRADDKGKYNGYKINLHKALKGKSVDAFTLAPHDIVYVPRTEIANLNQFVDQYINKLVPQPSFFYQTPVGDATIGVNTGAR